MYFALTNNTSRTVANIDAANPRGPNPTGHIIRWRERGNRNWATKFDWDIFVLAGPEGDSQVLPAQNGPALTQDNIFASPDGVWIDNNGILWIQTDMSGSQQAGPVDELDDRPDFGANGAVFRHPDGAEPTVDPSGPRPRSATIVITREDGGVVGLQHRSVEQ